MPPFPACLRKVRAACWLCNGTERQPGTLRLSPHQVNQLQGGWAHTAIEKLIRIPASHPEAFLNRKKNCFFLDVRGEVFSACVLQIQCPTHSKLVRGISVLGINFWKLDPKLGQSCQ